MSCEGRAIWDIHRDRPSNLLFDTKNVSSEILPSDSRYRLDIIAMKRGEDETKIVEETKKIMERENNDELLRSENRKKR